MVNQYQNKFLNQCLNPYVMLTLSVVAVAASIVGHRSGTEVFALVLLHIVMILVSVRIAHTDHRLFSTRFFIPSWLWLWSRCFVMELPIF